MTRGKRWFFTAIGGMLLTAILLSVSMRSTSNVPLSDSDAYSIVDSVEDEVAETNIAQIRSSDIDAIAHTAGSSIKVRKSTRSATGTTKKVSSQDSKYPDWWLKAWSRSAVSSLLDVFVGDKPLFPACGEGNQGSKGYPFEAPRDYLARNKNPCWYEYSTQREKGLRCAPYFYLAGVAKGGTTDLYRRIRLHPDVMFGTEKEYHWWDRSRYRTSSKDPSTGSVKLLGGVSLTDYVTKITGGGLKEVASELRDGGSSVKIFGDGSPSYLWDSFYWVVLDGNQGCVEPRVITGHHIRHFYPPAKIILIFRHPTPRLYSRFLSRIPRTPSLRKATSVDFHKYVVNGIRLYRECYEKWSIRHCAYNHTVYQEAIVRLVEGMYPVFMADWLRIWPTEQMLILRYEDYSENMEPILRKVFDFLELAPLNRTQMDIVTAEEKYNVGDMYEKVGEMLPETKAILDDFYQPFIYKFAEIMKDDRFLWTDKSH